MVSNDVWGFPAEAIRAFGQVLVGFVHEPSLEVTERVQVGNQLDEALLAVLVDCPYFFARKRRGFLPDCLMITKGEGVLDVELEFVETKFGQQVDQTKDCFHGGNLASAYVEHESSSCEDRAIFDFDARETSGGRFSLHQPRKGGEGSENSCFLACGNGNAIWRNSQFIGFGAGENFLSDHEVRVSEISYLRETDPFGKKTDCLFEGIFFRPPTWKGGQGKGSGSLDRLLRSGENVF